MAHVKKFTANSVGGLSIHIDRKTTNHSNEDIDIERTKLNYDLCETEGDLQSRYQKRLSEVYCMKREDVKSCASWVVTLPEELKEKSDKEKELFFRQTYLFLSKRYGRENVVSGMVHNDETTPHLHFVFVPVVFDEKKKREKVSAKLVLDRKELQKFHPDLDNYLKKRIPNIYQEGILNGKTIGIDDMKVLKEKSAEIVQAKETLDLELKKIKLNGKPLVDINKIEQRSYEKGVLNKRIELAPEDYKNLVLTAKENVKLRKIANQKMKENKQLKDSFEDVKYDYQSAVYAEEYKNDVLVEEKKELIQENKKLQQELQAEIDKRVLYADILINDFNVIEWSRQETNARMILNKLDRGLEPQDVTEGQDWQETLEKARHTNIKPDRLERGINKIKEIIERMKEILLAQRRKREREAEQDLER